MDSFRQSRATTFAGFPACRWCVGESEFTAVPTAGARLVTWDRVAPSGNRQNLLFWPGDTEGRDFAAVRGGNPILFPFCARTFVDGVIHVWRDPAGVVRPMPLHGLARQAEFRVTRLDERGFRAEMVPGEEARAAYPFEYRFEVDYLFHESGFRVELALENLGTETLPWSAGHHFYIAVPWSEGATRAEYEIAIPATRAWRQDAAGRLDEVGCGPQPESLASARLVATMHGGLDGEELGVVERPTGSRLGVAMPGVRADFPDAVFTTWTQDEHSRYFCIEPWMGPANAPELGMGVDCVEPGRRRVFPVEVRFQSA